MKKIESLKENYEFKRVYKRGKSSADSYVAVYFYKNYHKKSRIGITVSSKIAKAVKRNKIKRRLKSAYIEVLENISPGLDIVIVSRTRANFADFNTLKKSLVQNLKKLNVWVDLNEENS